MIMIFLIKKFREAAKVYNKIDPGVLASLAGAEPRVMLDDDNYDIEGRTAAELGQQMNICGVAWTNGNICVKRRFRVQGS